MNKAVSWRGALTRRGLLAAGIAGALPPRRGRAAVTNPRLSIAEPRAFVLQSHDQIQHRFDLYKKVGIDTLRVSVDWWEQETADGVWRGAIPLPYFRQAADNGFQLKMAIATISEPPDWYMTAHPDARLLNRDHLASRSDISYWYPGLRDLMAAKANHLFGYLAKQNLFPAIHSIFVDCGPAAEPIYPALWTLGPEFAGREASFWFYDPNAQSDFGIKMRTAYAGVLSDANHAWGTSFTSWNGVRIPEVGTRQGAMWDDVLKWYRDAKRSFVKWQVANYQAQLHRHTPAWQPKLILMVPGSHIRPAAWRQAVRQGNGDYSIKIMSDSEYLIDLAARTGCWLQYTGVENAEEVAYLMDYMKSNLEEVPMWGENGGNPAIGADPQRLAKVVSDNQLYGLEYINAAYVFDEWGSNPNLAFSKLADAYSFLLKH